MQLCGSAFLLQTLLGYYILVAALPAKPREYKASSLEWRAHLQKEFGSSAKLSKQVLGKTRNLKRHYLSERLPGASLSLVPHSELLSTVTLDLQSWLSLSDVKRLSYLSKMLPFYQGLVQKLKDYEADQEGSQFVSQFEDIGFNLRDLSHHVSYQISLLGLPSENQPEPTLKPPQILQNQSQWKNHQEVYFVLRHLENFLCRATREFWMLKVKARM